MTSLRKLQEYIIHISVAITIFVIGILIVNGSFKGASFEYNNFSKQQIQYLNCLNNEKLVIEARDFHDNFINQSNLEQIVQQYNKIVSNLNCDANHVISSYEQVQEMALEVLAYAQEYYEQEEVLLVNSVYTIYSRYSALLNIPKPYLFFASNDAQTKIVAITIMPTKEGYKITALWDDTKSNNLEYTQQQIQKLLIVYNEIKR